MKKKFNKLAIPGAVKSALSRIKGASKKKKACLMVGVVVAGAFGIDPDLAGGLIEYFMTE